MATGVAWPVFQPAVRLLSFGQFLKREEEEEEKRKDKKCSITLITD